jgi:BON domain-containing protein
MMGNLSLLAVGFPYNLSVTQLLVRGWWNWQTRTLEGRMAKAVQVQVLSRAPFSSRWLMCVRFFLASGVIITSVAFSGGCATDANKANEPQPSMRAMGQAVPSPTDSGETPTNESIGTEIRRELNGTPTTTAGIIVEVDDGKVTLRGTAPTLAASWHAEGIAHAVKGVKLVTNQIVVIMPSALP